MLLQLLRPKLFFSACRLVPVAADAIITAVAHMLERSNPRTFKFGLQGRDREPLAAVSADGSLARCYLAARYSCADS